MRALSLLLLALPITACGARASHPSHASHASGSGAGDTSAPLPVGLVERSDEIVTEDASMSMGSSEVVESAVLYRGSDKESTALQPDPKKRNTARFRGANLPRLDVLPGDHGDDPPVATPTRPESGAASVALQAPDWCDAYGGQARTRGTNTALPERLALTAESDVQDWVRALRTIALVSCDRQRYAPRQRRVANWLQQWVNATKMTIAETKPLLASLAGGKSADDVCPADDVGAWLVCPNARHSKHLPRLTEDRRGAADLLDRRELSGTEIDPLTRFLFAEHEPANPVAAVEFRLIDWAALDATLRAKTAQPYEARLVSMGLAVERRALSERIRQTDAAKIATAESAATNWRENVYAPNKARHDRAFGVLFGEASGDACAKIADDFHGMVRAKQPASLARALALAIDPVTQPVWRAHARCLAKAGKKSAAELLGSAVSGVTSWDGPRAAARAAIANRAEKASAERVTGAWLGTLTAVSAVADGVVLRFPDNVSTEDVEHCAETNRVSRINRDGTIEYRQVCNTVGKRTIREPIDPSKVSAKLATSLRAGLAVRVVDEQGGTAPRPAVVVGAYRDSASAEKDDGLLVFFDVPLR